MPEHPAQHLRLWEDPDHRVFAKTAQEQAPLIGQMAGELVEVAKFLGACGLLLAMGAASVQAGSAGGSERR